MNFRRAAMPALLLALLLLLSACASPAAQTDAGEAAISFADDNGRSVSLAAARPRAAVQLCGHVGPGRRRGLRHLAGDL